MHAHARLHLVA